MARSPADSFRALVLAAALLTSCGAAAAPRSIDECEAIKQADAYNRCLASFGPAAHSAAGRTSAPPPEAMREQAGASAAQRRRGRRIPDWLAARQAEGRARMQARHGVTVTRATHGRVRATIDLRRK